MTTATAPPVAPPRPAAPSVVVRAALLLGLASAVLLPGGRPGLGVPLLALMAAAVLLPLAVSNGRYDASARRAGYAAAALVLACAAAVRDAGWVVALDLLAAAALASVALVPYRNWAGVLAGITGVGLRAPVSVPWLLRGLRESSAQANWRGFGPVLRGVAATALLLAAFVPLLASADAAFARLVEGLAPDIRIDELNARLVLFVLGAVLAGTAARILLSPPPEPQLPPPSRTLSRRTEWLPPLAALAGLLALFIALQARVLFGGRDLVVARTGLTYAEYTRSGFWQLLIVTALVLAVVAAATRWTPGDRTVRALLGALCLLALIIDASALSRLLLYVDEYGLTRLRVLVATTCLWLAVVLVCVLIAGARRGGWLPQAVILSAAGALLLLTGADPDARIASSALERGARADVSYLSTLSADAVPVLDDLPPYQRGCALWPIAARLGTDGWNSANLSRSRARQLLADRPVTQAECVGPR